jgi:glycosyltransferase involved in cell wall biosynthesis
MKRKSDSSAATPRKACIFVDNLNVGGFQRLALDQAYELSDQGYLVKLFVLSDSQFWVLLRLEEDILCNKNIKIVQVSASRTKQIRVFYRNLRLLSDDTLIISHSLRSTFSLKILKVFSFRKFEINTTIHQVPRLSHLSQRIKRFVYAQFSDNLFCFSSAVRADWSTQFGKFGVSLVNHFSKQISVKRNGIYIKRLPPIRSYLDIKKPRVVYLGRVTFWKNITVFLDLAKELDLINFDFLIVVPNYEDGDLGDLPNILGSRLRVISGKTVSDLEVFDGDVHIYPSNYGTRVPVIESISLNCLEMASLGIPSLVTENGLSTWPELSGSDLIYQVDWNNKSQVVGKILEASSARIPQEAISDMRSLFDIGNQF